jgi:hypothetical protein
MLDITHFLKTATINGIQVGLSLEEYIATFGVINETNRHYYSQEDPSHGFSYFENGIEFMFVEGTLSTISLSASGSELTILSKHSINYYTNLEEMLSFLELVSVEWEFLSKYTFRQQLLIQTKTGIQLSFTYDKEHGMLLSKIQRYWD